MRFVLSTLSLPLMDDHACISGKSDEFVDALAKGIRVLEAFDENSLDMSLSEVARKVGVSPAAARRSLLTLVELGYVGKKNKRFFLRPKLLELGAAFYKSARIDEILQPELRRVVDEFGDASSIGIMRDTNVIYIAHHSEERARRLTAFIGAVYPAFATSIGRVLLAGIDDTDLENYLSKLNPIKLTAETCTDAKLLKHEILAVRENGFSTTVDQLDYGITALAVPIHDTNGNVIASINTSAYTGNTTPEKLIERRLSFLKKAASNIAQTLTRYPTLKTILRP